MSLILDALKKLERDKTAPDPGVVVVGSLPWPGVKPARSPAVGLAIAALLGVIGVGAATAWILWPRSAREHTAAPIVQRGADPLPVEPTPVAPAAYASTAPPSPRQLELPSAAREAAAPAEDAAAGGTGDAATLEQAPLQDDLQLTAISQRDGQPIAIINDRLVHEGDSFDGVRILRIGEAEVEVDARGRRRVLRF